MTFRLPLTLAFTLLLAACHSAEAPTPGEVIAEAQVASEADMRAAQSLSIGRVQALDDSIGPYVQALRCRIALDTINRRFADTGGFSDEQKRLMREAQSIYERRFAQLGAQNNKSDEEIQGDLRDQAEKIPEMATRGQLAIGCLYRLINQPAT
jgi:hypothetical protein